MKEKRWINRSFSPSDAQNLARQMEIPLLVAQVLCARGLCTRQAVEEFLSTDSAGLHDPFLLPQMERAVEVIHRAMRQKKKIAVFGDYDVDGITATCLVVDYLRQKGVPCQYYIPDRLSEGYGLNTQAIRALAEQGVGLLITVDAGITAQEEIALANAQGMEVVVTDHHQCKHSLPPAAAVVNPQIGEGEGQELAGVGVAFKLLCALEGGGESQGNMLERYADLVAVGTIADVMPLRGENRIIAAAGLRQLAHTKNLGLASLLRVSGVGRKKITSSLVGFTLAPRINAAGRVGVAARGAELLLTRDANTAQRLAEMLCEQNRQRQAAEADILRQALRKLTKEYDPLRDPVIVLWGEGWHHGVIGIVASRLCDMYHCPVILISLDGEEGKGSGRSVGGFNLFQALEHCGDLLLKYGGHEMAAGLTISRGQLEPFRQRLCAYAAGQFQPQMLQAALDIDCEVSMEQLTLENARDLSLMEPYGMGNPQPLFALRDMRVEEIIPISSDKHSRLLLEKDGRQVAGVWFGITSTQCGFVPGSRVDAAFHLEINEFRGRRSVQLLIKDIRLSRCELERDDVSQQAYQRYINGDALEEEQVALLYPDRADLVAVWRHLVARAREGMLAEGLHALPRKIQWESKRAIPLGKALVCLDVFSESRLIDYWEKQEVLYLRLLAYEGKADISKSVVLATLQKMRRAGREYERT